MGRQRTIDGQNFWHASRLEGCTSEDKLALLHLLTGPRSNITGIYTLPPRVAGAELGWDSEQWAHVVRRLQAKNLACYDAPQHMIWVKIWWEHYDARETVSTKLRGRTMEQIRDIPQAWLSEFLADFRVRLTVEQQRKLQEGLAVRSGQPAPACVV